MASPVAHSFAGLWTFLLLVWRTRARVCERWVRFGQLCLLVLVANLADFDFVPEIIFHRDFHHGFTHSLLAAVLAAFLFASIWKIAGTFWASGGIYFIAYSSHLLIDLVTGAQLGWNHTGYGIPLFWPSPENDLRSLLVLDYGLKHGSFSAIFSLANLQAVCYDLALFGTITAALLLSRARDLLKSPRMSAPRQDSACMLQAKSAHRE